LFDYRGTRVFNPRLPFAIPITRC